RRALPRAGLAAVRPRHPRGNEAEEPPVKARVMAALTWVVGPLAVAALAGGLAQTRASARDNRFLQATVALPEAERSALAAATDLAVANLIWAGGSEEAVRNMFRADLDRQPPLEGARRAQVFVRFGIIDKSFDGQAAL